MPSKTGSGPVRLVARWSAQLESFLSTHAFEVVFGTIYALANVFQFVWGAHDEFHYNPSRPLLFKYLIAVARGAGYSLNLNCALIILLACRLVLTTVRETPLHNVLPLDRAFPDAHVVVGGLICVGVAIHVPFHFGWLIRFNAWDTFGLWSFSMSVAVGVPLLLTLVAMLVTALPWFREHYFHLFYLSHIVGATIFFPLLLLHGMYRKEPETYKWVLGPMILYMADRVARRVKISSADLSLSGRNAIRRSGSILEVRVPKPFAYRAGQYAEIAVPSLRREWHPFTIASAPHEPDMAFYIKPGGDWTKKLLDAFDARHTDPSMRPLAVRVRGPFGAPAQHSAAYKRVVLISGGIGATPFAAIAKHLHYRATHKAERRHNVEDMRRFPEAERRLSLKLSDLYQLGGAGVDPESAAVRTAAGVHVAEALALSNSPDCRDRDLREGDDNSFDFAQSPNKQGKMRNYSERTSSSSEASAPPNYTVSLQDDKKIWSTTSLAVVNGTSARVLSFLHTTRVTVALIFTVIARATLVVIVSIFNLGTFGWKESTMKPSAFWAFGAETMLSALMTAMMIVILGLEISFLGKRFFGRLARWVDLFFFVPLSIMATMVSAQSWAQRNVRGGLTVWHFAILLPALFVLLSYRLYRSIGSRDLLATHAVRARKETPPDVDFVWTTPYAADDQWLLDELAPLEDGNALRLHRYVTRGDAVDVEAGRHISTKSGRPKWGEIFMEVAGRTPSGSDVGVFFCGPVAMGTAIRDAMRAAEVESNLRGAYLTKKSDRKLCRDLALDNYGEVKAVREVGSNVRFVFREENF